MKSAAENIFSEYVDVWILSSNPATSDGAATLLKLATDTAFKCCLDIESYHNSFNGIVRAITYKQADELGAVESLDDMYEGRVTASDPSGFGRQIRAKLGRTFVGYLEADE